jgi:hypothetical protein
MTFKKMLLLASMALAAVAFSVPASASAQEWTHSGASFTGHKTDTLTGKISFGNPAPGQNKFGCVAHAGLTVFGGTTTGEIENFLPTTSTCTGEGIFSGCQLISDETTGLPHLVHTLNTDELTVEEANIVIHNTYDAACPVERTTLTVEDVTLDLNGTSNLTDVTVSGLAEAHSFIPGVGEITQIVGVFGTVHTATDTLSIK